jgi:hypothetical protein
MQTPLIIGSDTILTFLKSAGRGLPLNVGDIVKAEVINAMESGLVSLRITRENGERGIITAKSSVPLDNGDSIFLKVIGGDKEIRLQLMGTQVNGGIAEDANAAEVPKAVLTMLSELSGSRIRSTDLNIIRDIFKSLPEEILAAYPEFETIGQLLPEIERLNANLLKSSIEGSGLLFEARLKLAAQEVMQGDKGGILPRLLSDPDLKGLLLKFRELLKDGRLINAVKSSGYTEADAAGAADRLIKNMEFFQLTSRIHDMLYTFLPLAWGDLKDGELSLRKDHTRGDRSYTCDINLDLEHAGKIAASVTMCDGAFYVSFHAEKQETRSLIISEKGLLEKGFAETGLLLKVVTVGNQDEIMFGAAKPHGFDLKV